MIVSMILAVSENGVIGRDNDLPWSVPADMRYFMRTTTGHPILMGRKTYESLGKPLPRRRNVVITRNLDLDIDGVDLVHSIVAGLELVQEEEEVFIIGGGTIYQQALELQLVNRIYRTVIHAAVEGDTHFFLPEDEAWQVVQEETHPADEKNQYPYTFQVLELA